MDSQEQDRVAELLVQSERAFTLVVLEEKTLREAAAELGVSHETVRQRVKSYKKFLADDRRVEDVEERRAAFDLKLSALARKALYLYEKVKDTKPLAAVGALNSAIAILTHQRAVQGLDTPKAVEAKQDITYTVVWDETDAPQAGLREGDETPA